MAANEANSCPDLSVPMFVCLSVPMPVCQPASQPASMVVGCRSVCQLVHWPVAKSTKSTRTALTTKDVAPQRITFLLSLAPSVTLFLSLSPPLSNWQNNAALNCRIIASKNCKYAYACQCQCKLIHSAYVPLLSLHKKTIPFHL